MLNITGRVKARVMPNVDLSPCLARQAGNVYAPNRLSSISDPVIAFLPGTRRYQLVIETATFEEVNGSAQRKTSSGQALRPALMYGHKGALSGRDAPHSRQSGNNPKAQKLTFRLGVEFSSIA